ncbi:uncharacterized protein E0L32_011879 [Thyridium curvatum]|uniref:Uncharacterized protein n=1 Tax=Thyridium curvatum TaxID=1093900 RepID=A0A507BMU1_9PEZI|nr:uncharacterized protein E0L32_011879 [Thyridium curvatum]TPX18060.1 hypothetical protein E0L32_011879 [Thyridium curvatum]
MAASRHAAGGAIEISDDDATSGTPEPQRPADMTAPAYKKRKLSNELAAEKVEWTDDSDGEYERLLKNRKRKTAARGRKKADNKATRSANTRDGAGSSRAQASTSVKQEDPYDAVDLPDYIRRRRKDFEENRKVLKEAGLRLPPDYSEIEFSDDEQLATLEEKPVFDEASGIKPSREYKDVELEYSAGLIPASIAQYLRDYQIVGVKFLHQLFVYQKGGILGDDMGLGKTVQVAAFLTAAFGKTGDVRDKKRMRKMRRAGEDYWYPRVLIVCPGSLIQNWKNELDRWGYWITDLYHGPDKDSVLQAAKAGRIEIMITTYTTYKNHRENINTVQWDAVVADECHSLKDRKSGVTQAMNEVNALCRIGLTGTAIQNKYEELWTLLNWTNPGHFGTLSEWRKHISTPLTIGQSHEATLYELSRARKTAKKLVHNLLPEFFLRRMKTLIAHQLPKKSDKVVFCPLTNIQREAYENFLESDIIEMIRSAPEPCHCGSGKKRGWCCHRFLPNGKTWQAYVFPAMFTLQKLSNHLMLLLPTSSHSSEKTESELETLQTCLPDKWDDLYRHRDSMLNLATPDFCGKWKVLKKLLQFWYANKDKVLVFSHSVRLLNILKNLFSSTSYNVSYLDGSLSYEERQQVVDNFNSDPSQFVFLISTKAGGVGLNITSANKVVIVDPHWNPAYDLQAQDRAYRIGQVRDVDVFRLISAGTIEEIVYARQIYKQQQANIGYNASSERRYFKGVQQDSGRKGEIFGLDNLLTYRPDQVVLRDIVNKTNIAEAKAGVALSDIDLEKAARDEDDEFGVVKKEGYDGVGGAGGDEDGGLSQLAELLTAENKDEALSDRRRASKKPRSDAVQAILASVGVEYTHENSEVVGSSRVEAQLSRRAELVEDDEWSGQEDEEEYDNDDDDAAANSGDGGTPGPTARHHHRHSALFADSQANSVPAPSGHRHLVYRPPRDVMGRQFCSMAREFGFGSATDFALVVESWTQEQRRNCLDLFYKRREARLAELEGAGAGAVVKGEEEGGGDEQLVVLKKKDENDDDVKVKKEVLDAAEQMGIEDAKVEVENARADGGAMGRMVVKVEEETMVAVKAEPVDETAAIMLDDDATEDGTDEPAVSVRAEEAELEAKKSDVKLPPLSDKGKQPAVMCLDEDTEDDETDEL